MLNNSQLPNNHQNNNPQAHTTPHQAPPSGTTHTTNMSSMSELFELLDKLQSSRLDDQRCEMPRTLNRPNVVGVTTENAGNSNQLISQQQQRPPASRVLDNVLQGPSPYPQVVVEGSSYWVDPGDREEEGEGETEGEERETSQGCTLCHLLILLVEKIEHKPIKYN